MNETQYIWMNGRFVSWKKATIHVLAHTLHYGAGAFEGIRCYETANGPAIFRLDDHVKRWIYSSKAVGMKLKYGQKELEKACIDTVKKNKIRACYIRPITFYGYGKMGLYPVGAPVETVIACWPWGKYLGGDVVKVKTSSFVRIHPKSGVTDAKINGHYVNSIMASLEVHKNRQFDEALFLDYKGNVAEGPGENIFMVKKNVIYTPKLGTILGGITRSSVMHMAKDLGYKVVEKTLKPSELKKADEAFFTGTAAEVTGISKIDSAKIGNGKMGPVTKQLKDLFHRMVRGEEKKYNKWLTLVK